MESFDSFDIVLGLEGSSVTYYPIQNITPSINKRTTITPANSHAADVKPYYNNGRYANPIFNPFSVKEGNILNVPANDSDLYVESDEPSLPDGSKFSNSSRGEKTMSYAEKIEYLAKKGLGVK